MLRNILLNNKSIINSKTLKANIIDFGKRTFKFPIIYMYKILRIDERHTARPDRLSEELYGVNHYGDVLCKMNNISNPFEFNVDEVIVVPSFEYLDDFIFYDGEHDDEEVISLPKSKKKTEKRKASDSIIGDERFKIDNTKRIIIY
jgi:hypothetical protein